MIDPIYSQTAELADLYIQIKPRTDGVLAMLLVKLLNEKHALDPSFIEKHTVGFPDFMDSVNRLDKQQCLDACGIQERSIEILAGWLQHAKSAAHIVGSGLQRHPIGKQHIQSIASLAAARGDLGKQGGGILLRSRKSRLFNNQMIFNAGQNGTRHRLLRITDLFNESVSLAPPIDLLWITSANPMHQAAYSNRFANYLGTVPFVVTVDQYFTATTKMSNLILPTTTHFEELDIVPSFWHDSIALNEQAIAPYFQSKSEWTMMRNLAARLQKEHPDLCSFPLHASEEEYLNAQFNQEVFEHYRIRSISDLRGKIATPDSPAHVCDNIMVKKPAEKYPFYAFDAEQIELQLATPHTKENKGFESYPFLLLTSRNAYTFHSHHLQHLFDEEEAFISIHPKAGAEHRISNGEIVKIYNDQFCLLVKAVYSDKVPSDILLFHAGTNSGIERKLDPMAKWTPDKRTETVRLPGETEMFDTFVTVAALK
ncbi:MAG: molybdopterin-dependent oxidoreductase [Paenibacillus macerans]|uniref:molybdopterin-dependent oxidoreductase n=1 Tax=Paenibacillus macerans TaxID=44252 RepID=UPI0024329158|nr:molybdopterin-dependent oxidoreductase [Paenibacillus macerans]MBS5914993.1 molybdopterin-dependent oxidoreductase [Paenibacillus macerans]